MEIWVYHHHVIEIPSFLIFYVVSDVTEENSATILRVKDSKRRESSNRKLITIFTASYREEYMVPNLKRGNGKVEPAEN